MTKRDILRTSLEVEKEGVRREIERDLRTLASQITEAHEALAAGGRINANLVARHSMLTESIARYNQIRSIMPLLEGEP